MYQLRERLVGEEAKRLGATQISLVDHDKEPPSEILNIPGVSRNVLGAGAAQGHVSRKSRNFSGAFRVTYFSLYLQNEGVSRHVTLQLF